MKKTIIGVVAVVAVVACVVVSMKYTMPTKGPKPVPGKAAAAEAPTVPIEPPYWNNENLGGTNWTGNIKGIAIKIAFQPAGILKVTSDSVLLKKAAPSGEIPGTWSIDGSKFKFEIDVPKFGKQKMSGTVSGKQFVDDEGKAMPLQQVQ